MAERPTVTEVLLPRGELAAYGSHTIRRLSSMRGQYADSQAFAAALAAEDVVVYEVYGAERPEIGGDLIYGTSIVHPGKVGDEYHMTKGHFHARLERAEVYYCLWGQGMMVMETPEGECAVEELRPGRVLYVPLRWAHRSVNTSPGEDLVTLFVYPADAGHDYDTIDRQGFRKRVLERDGGPVVVDNACWRPRSA
jgi:glucose-6-phosphate isomerase